MKNEIEQRRSGVVERSNPESRTISGYALLFNRESNDLGGFREVINPEALTGVIEVSDVYALINHDQSRGILARSKFGNGSLSLSIDNKGLRYEFEAPNTALGDEIIEMLTRGDITESSFAFTVAEDKWSKNPDGSYIRHIIKIDRLYDVSPVYSPAYNDTFVECKRFNEVQSIDKQQLKSYYNDIKSKFLKK